jgi:hypothetical protein
MSRQVTSAASFRIIYDGGFWIAQTMGLFGWKSIKSIYRSGSLADVVKAAASQGFDVIEEANRCHELDIKYPT